MKNRKKIFISMVIIIILIGCGIGYYIYQGHSKQADINKKVSEISEFEKEFSTAKERSDKLNVLKFIIEKMNKYNHSSKKYSEVSDKYEGAISNMQTVFKEEYNNIIKENTIDNLDSVEDTGVINVSTENLHILSTTIESEKEYTLSNDAEYKEYTKKISDLTAAYSTQIATIEEKRKAEEDAKKQAEDEKAKTHYENEYFSVDVPQQWIDCWSVTEETASSDGNTYFFSYEGDNTTSETSGGGVMLYVVDVTYGLPQNGKILNAECELVGYTSNNFGVFMGVEAGAGFFTHGATITLK